MAMKDYNLVLDQNEARTKAQEGINLAANLVSKTLGAKSRRVMIDQEFGGLDASDDGTTILSKLNLKDPKIGIGVKIAQEASAKTNVDEGDGTTTTLVILDALVNELLRKDTKAAREDALAFDKKTGNNARREKEIRAGVKKVIDYINKNKIEVTTKEQLAQIGKVSANNEEIGNMLADIFDKLGKEGAVSISDGTGLNTTHEIIPGMSFDQGWLAAQFVTDTEREEAVLESNERDVKILITSIKVQDPEHAKKIGELYQAGIKDLLIIADDVSGIPLGSLVVNKLRDVMRAVAVRAPQLGSQSETLKDLCIATGATLVGGDGNVKFEELKPEHLGNAKRVVVTKNKTVIVGDGKQEDKIKERVKQLQFRIDNESSDYEKTKLQERISKLNGGVGSIKVGGNTPLEIKDRKAKITDAVAAVKSAMRGGVLPGGGVALLMASKELDMSVEGEKMLSIAIQKPFEQIMENSDVDATSMKKKSLETGHGFNADTEEFGDLVAMGIIDPANVVTASVQNAVSNALIVASLGGAIAQIRDDKEKHDEEN